MEQRKNKKKFFFFCRKLEWATAYFHFVLGHDTAHCIMTQLAKRAARGPRYGQQPWDTVPRQGQPARKGERGLASKVCRDTMFRILTVDNGTALRYSVAKRHDMAQGAATRTVGALYHDTIFVSQRGEAALVL